MNALGFQNTSWKFQIRFDVDAISLRQLKIEVLLTYNINKEEGCQDQHELGII